MTRSSFARPDVTTAPGRRLTMAFLAAAVFMLFLDTTVVNVALSSIAVELEASIEDLQWVVDAYLLAMSIALLPAGAAVDRLGPRATLLLGLAVFSVASVGCAVAGSVQWLVAARALQGAGAATVVPASLSLIAVMYVGERQRAHAVALWTAIGTVALAGGPLLGAVVVQEGGWRWLFWLNVPVGAWALVQLVLLRGADRREFVAWDPVAQVLVAASAAAVLLVLLQLREWGASDYRIVAAGAVGLVTLAVLAVRVRRRESTGAPGSWLTRPEVASLLAAGAGAFFGLYAVVFTVPMMDQAVFGRSIFSVGLGCLPLTGCLLATSFTTGWLVNRLPAQTLVAAGLALMSAGLFALAAVGLDPANPARLLAMAAIGAGTAYSLTPATIALLRLAGPELAGRASGLSNLARNLGACLGVAYAGPFLGSPEAPDRTGGVTAVLGCGVLLAILALGMWAVARVHPIAATPKT